MTISDYDKCARRIAQALQLERGEQVLMKLDRRIFTGIVPPVETVIRASGAEILGVIPAEDPGNDLDALRRLFNSADVFLWLPELHQGNPPALAQALNEWLDAKRGRAVHFHWHSGYPLCQ